VIADLFLKIFKCTFLTFKLIETEMVFHISSRGAPIISR